MRSLAILLAVVFVVVAPGAGAQSQATTSLDDLTWTELRDRIAGGATTVLVPVGGTEENGPHMTLGKHNVRVKVLAGKVATALGNALVAPVVAYVPEGGTNPPSSHMRFPGTITVPVAAFEAMLESVGRSLKLAGFRDVVFLGDHGGYRNSLNTVATRLDREWKGSNVRAHAIVEYYDTVDGAFAQALRDRGYTAAEIGTHAGLADTSLALAVDPGLVRSERLASAAKSGAADGVYGDPRRATAELGQIGVDLVVNRTVDAIRKATARR